MGNIKIIRGLALMIGTHSDFFFRLFFTGANQFEIETHLLEGHSYSNPRDANGSTLEELHSFLSKSVPPEGMKNVTKEDGTLRYNFHVTNKRGL